ncbi:MAG: toll/interleukin-1 receptor domain-containing protein, partial [Alphaproteobacteria bacterium]|nr:toll/interleukin-1 receptor domain-containing protein [Alphaproteobacteria bacterium]
MPKRIFVSHSSHDDAARNFIDELRAVLTSEGYDVLVDRDGHRPGEAWTPELHRWLAECDAAILMFSPDALASDWVFKEATILTFRASVHRDVRLLPVRDPRVPTALFESKHWAPLQANLLQMIELTDVSGVAAAAKEAFGPARQILTPYEELWTAVVSVLSKFDPAFLASAVDKRCPAPLRARRGSPRRSRAEALTDWVLLDALRGMDGLYDLVETDLRIPIRTEGLRERILDLAEQVDPLWISRDTAEPFVVAPSSNRQPIAINGAHLKWYTIKCLLRRAGVEPAPRYLVSCDPAIQS